MHWPSGINSPRSNLENGLIRGKPKVEASTRRQRETLVNARRPRRLGCFRPTPNTDGPNVQRIAQGDRVRKIENDAGQGWMRELGSATTTRQTRRWDSTAPCSADTPPALASRRRTRRHACKPVKGNICQDASWHTVRPLGTSRKDKRRDEAEPLAAVAWHGLRDGDVGTQHPWLPGLPWRPKPVQACIGTGRIRGRVSGSRPRLTSTRSGWSFVGEDHASGPQGWQGFLVCQTECIMRDGSGRDWRSGAFTALLGREPLVERLKVETEDE
ncbi:hypothetical protein PCL_04362 [Purpureocillium lilacinum]|uniref:Uncharacterized protein n=1 Tax=Purpureocillium lilacinum TaxID=33203 RepID=A0A2U3DY60_PURLI|nr:hypothetical protein PCL_04362 [Purpureocillium lilacinum]